MLDIRLRRYEETLRDGAFGVLVPPPPLIIAAVDTADPNIITFVRAGDKALEMLVPAERLFVATWDATEQQQITTLFMRDQSSGRIFDKKEFSAINLVNGDSIQFSYKLSLNK